MFLGVQAKLSLSVILPVAANAVEFQYRFDVSNKVDLGFILPKRCIAECQGDAKNQLLERVRFHQEMFY